MCHILAWLWRPFQKHKLSNLSTVIEIKTILWLFAAGAVVYFCFSVFCFGIEIERWISSDTFNSRKTYSIILMKCVRKLCIHLCSSSFSSEKVWHNDEAHHLTDRKKICLKWTCSIHASKHGNTCFHHFMLCIGMWDKWIPFKGSMVWSGPHLHVDWKR